MIMYMFKINKTLIEVVGLIVTKNIQTVDLQKIFTADAILPRNFGNKLYITDVISYQVWGKC